MSHGTLRDGVGRSQVVAYLQGHLEAAQEGGGGFAGLPIHATMPTVHVLSGTSEQDRQRLIRAIQFVNTALPHGKKLTLGAPLTNPGPRDDIQRLPEIPTGTILVEFSPASQWRPAGQSYAATLHPLVAFDSNDRMYLRASHIHFDPAAVWIEPDRGGPLDREQNIAGQLVHELLHALGFLEHPDVESNLSYNRSVSDYGGKPGHVIYALDREAVRAAYTRLAPNAMDIGADLGPWLDTSTHVMGEIASVDVEFGATVRNGVGYGWASGPAPSMSLADNDTLTGSASWSGRFLGLTPQAAVVAGDADLTVTLATMAGELEFSDLESWAANAAPGATDSGSTWGDGDLEYQISVSGSAFHSTGGDAGTVTGAFFGSAHEGMGGTLERADLSGGFGGTR